MARQGEMFVKAGRERRWRAHVVDAGNGPGPGHWAEFECGRCGWRSGWTKVKNFTEGKRGVPCPVCNKNT